MFRSGGSQTQTLSVDPQSRATVSVNDAVGSNREVAAVINSTEPILAERPMYFKYHGKNEGGHNTIGSPFTYTSWYFAEGYTGPGFDEWICILNPTDETANVTITYMFRKGGTQTQTVAVPARSRETVSVNEAVGYNRELSAKVESAQQIVVERPMYYGYQGYGPVAKWNGGHLVMGTTTTSNSWYFAEGYTGSNFEEWFTLQNPNPSAVTVNITYMFRGGGGQSQSVSLPGNSRETIDVNGVVGSNKEVSAVIEASQPIIAERPMYFKYNNEYDGGDVKMGAYVAWEYWFFAEGYTGPGFDEWLTLQNPQGAPADVTVTYMFRGGGTQAQTLTVGPFSRETVKVNDIIGSNKEVSAMISASRPIVAERPIYFRYHGTYVGGF